MDDSDDGARVGLWVVLAVITLLLFGLIGGLAMRQMHKSAPVAAGAAAVAAADVLIDGPISGDLIGKVYFDLGAATLPGDVVVTVAAVQTALAGAQMTDKLVLSGFHDASGDAVKNAELAKARAKAVRGALQAAGIDASRIGLRKPESTTGDGKPEEARRVEVRLVH